MNTLQQLLADPRLIGGGIVCEKENKVQFAMPIVGFEAIHIGSFMQDIIYLWKAVRDTSDQLWEFWDDKGSYSLHSDLINFAAQARGERLTIVIEDVSETRFSWRVVNPFDWDTSIVLNTIYYAGHFPVTPNIVVGIPKDVTDPSSWGAPTLSLEPDVWKGLIGFNDQATRNAFEECEFINYDYTKIDLYILHHLIPRHYQYSGYLQEVLITIFDRGGVMTPSDLDILKSIIEHALTDGREYLSTESKEVFEEILVQLE